ncbi:PDZ domain-containing protein [Chromobacterium haemolyticum]|nr:PDZ domain-containing protein [Chromobacterium haemolyticum]
MPLVQLLATQGVELRFEPAANAGDRGGLALNGKPAPASLGVKAVAEAQGVRVINVYDGGAAQRAGLSGGDVIVAIDKLKAVDLDKALARYQPGDKLKLHWFRRDELISAQVELQAAPADACRLLLQDDGARWLRR